MLLFELYYSTYRNKSIKKNSHYPFFSKRISFKPTSIIRYSENRTDISEPKALRAEIFCTRCNFQRFIFINSTNCRQLRFIRLPETELEWAGANFLLLQAPWKLSTSPPLQPSPDLIIFHCPRVDKLLTGKLYCALPLKGTLGVENVAINGSDYGVFLLFSRGIFQQGLAKGKRTIWWSFPKFFWTIYNSFPFKNRKFPPAEISQSKSNFYCAPSNTMGDSNQYGFDKTIFRKDKNKIDVFITHRINPLCIHAQFFGEKWLREKIYPENKREYFSFTFYLGNSSRRYLSGRHHLRKHF